MSIFGTSYPAIVHPLFRIRILDPSEDLPETAIITREPDDYIRDIIVNKSVITGKKHHHFKGIHLVFGLKIFNIDRDNLLYFKSIEGSIVTYYPHYTSNPIRHFECFVTEVTPFHFNDLVFTDAVVVTMETVDYWNETASTILDSTGANPIDPDNEGYLIDENGDHIVDELGNKIIINLYDKEV